MKSKEAIIDDIRETLTGFFVPGENPPGLGDLARDIFHKHVFIIEEVNKDSKGEVCYSLPESSLKKLFELLTEANKKKVRYSDDKTVMLEKIINDMDFAIEYVLTEFKKIDSDLKEDYS